MKKIESKIVLGTANFGQQYGLDKNSSGLSREKAQQIMCSALESGVNRIDTAQSYGKAMDICFSHTHATRFKFFGKIQFGKSLDQLADFCTQKKVSFDSVMVHLDPRELPCTGDLTSYLNKMKKYSQFGRIGLSIYNESDVDTKILKAIKILQIPYSIFDRRFKDSGYIDDAKAEGVEIHARSIFLQGLILIDAKKLSQYFNRFKESFKLFEEFCMKANITKHQAALNFVLAEKKIDGLVVGVDSEKQLAATISLETQLVDTEMSKVPNFTKNDLSLILPYLWQV